MSFVRGPSGLFALLAAAAVALSGCMNGGILRAAAPTPVPTIAPTPTATPAADPQPLSFPLDEGPHDRLTEWWYYTGHLATPDGRRLGFEFVIFRAERGDFPVAWASHFAITDERAGTFGYEERSEFGPQVDRSPADGGFELSVSPPGVLEPSAGGGAPSQTWTPEPWTMSGRDGRDRLIAVGSPGAIFLNLGTDRAPVLHDEDGWIDLGPAGGTYYYSRTRMEIVGKYLPEPGRAIPVTGIGWFDHQWGDFIAVGAGGWDWFAVNLDDGTDLTLSLIRAADGSYPLTYGTLVRPNGASTYLSGDEFSVAVTDHWTSPRTGATYPAGWGIELPGERLEIELTPTVPDQELDTRATTGVVYWEGSQIVRAVRAGNSLSGEAYVELTGYAGG